jgi:hypothetical protein
MDSTRRLSENEEVFSRSRKAKIIAAGIRLSILRIIIELDAEIGKNGHFRTAS